jgi:hypothetical protein
MSSAPDEVTLGFAVGSDASGQVRPLPENLVLATILCAVDSERTRRNSLLRGPAETIEAASPVYWPLLVLPAPAPGRVAIFDGTGVWKRTFRHSHLPPVGKIRELLAKELPAPDLIARMRALLPLFHQDHGAQIMTVEGFLPVDPPLLFEVLSQSGFQHEPQSPHAGFLPARHPVQWYDTAIRTMGESLVQFESDVATLSTAREEVREIVGSAITRLDEDRGRLQTDLAERTRLAHAEMDKDVEALHHTVRQQIRAELLHIRGANTTISHAHSTAATAEVLAQRHASRGHDASDHEARARSADEWEREARRQVREAEHRVELIHEQERQSLGVLTNRAALVEQQGAERIGGHDLMRDELSATGAELLDMFASEIASRTAERNVLASYFLPLPQLQGVRILWFPLWVATLRSERGTRNLVFPPMQVRGGADLSSALKTLFGGVILPLEPRTAHFDSTFRGTIEAALASDSWFSHAMREIVRAADVTVDPDFLPRLADGLHALRISEWITDKQERRFYESYVEHVRTHISLLPIGSSDTGPPEGGPSPLGGGTPAPPPP